MEDGGLLAQLQAKKLRKIEPPKERESALKEVDESSFDPAKLKATPLAFLRFDKESSAWNAAQEAESPLPLPKKLILLTFNIWIQQLNMEKRMRALAALLESAKIDVATLQEATPLHFEKLLEQQYIRDYFFITSMEGQTSTYKTLILSRFPLTDVVVIDMPYSPRKMVRANLIFRDKKGNQRVLQVATVHLKSEAMANRQRREQLEYLYQHLKGADEEGYSQLISGDFNYQFKDEPNAFKNVGFIDVWNSLHPRDKGETFDATENPHAATTSCPSFKRRLDFVALRSSQFSASKISVVAKKPIEPGLWISDHWGLVATLKTC